MYTQLNMKRKIASSTVSYLSFLLRELATPINYLIAILVGATILLLQGSSPLASPIPYLVPVLVQSLSKSGVKFRNRMNALLLKLPGEREDPAIVVDSEGTILAATGRTRSLLEEHEITEVQQLLLTASCPDGLEELYEQGETVFTCFSDITRRWYRLSGRREDEAGHYLIWLDDITEEVRLEERLQDLQQFTAELVERGKRGDSAEELTAELARRVLKSGYTAIFATRDDDGALEGWCYRFRAGELSRSDLIRIRRDSTAPILLSSRRSRVVSAEKVPEQAPERFEIDNPFDRRVRGFVDEPIENYVNYAAGGVAVIAFNNRNGVSRYEERYIESVVNVFRIAYTLLDGDT